MSGKHRKRLLLLLLLPLGILAYFFVFDSQLFPTSFIPEAGTSPVEQELRAINANIEAVRGDLAVLKSGVVSVSELEAFREELSSLEIRISMLETEAKQLADVPAEVKIIELESWIQEIVNEVGKMRQDIDALRAEQITLEQPPEVETIAEEKEEEIVVEHLEEEEEVDVQEPNKVKLLTLSLSSVQYKPGDEVIIIGRTDPNVPVRISIVDQNSVKIFSQVVSSSNLGKYSIKYLVPDNASLGFHKVTASSGDRQLSSFFTVKVLVPSYAESQTGIITIKTDRITYSKGEYVSVSGTAPPRSTVIVSITFPSGNESSLYAQVDEDSKYQALLTITLDSSSGTWVLSAKQGSEVASLKITVV